MLPILQRLVAASVAALLAFSASTHQTLAQEVITDEILGAPAGKWEGCGTSSITIGQETTVCLVLANGQDWRETRKYMRLNFRPNADEYTRFHVPDSFRQLVTQTQGELVQTFSQANITVHASTQRAISMQRVFYDGFDKIYPHLTAVIDVKDGIAQGIAWDDACLWCTKSQCEENTYDFNGNLGNSDQLRQPTKGCVVSRTECLSLSTEGRTDCDLILYVVWTGTDSNGDAFQSSAYRFSAFPAQELADRFSQNLPDIPDLPDVPGTGNTDNN